MLINVVGCFLLLLCLAVFLVLWRAITLLRESVKTWERCQFHLRELAIARRTANEARRTFLNYADAISRERKELAEIKEALEAEFRSEKA